MKDYLECQHGIARVLKSLWSIACRYGFVRVRFRPLSGDTDARFTPFDLALKSAKWVAIVFASERTTLAWPAPRWYSMSIPKVPLVLW